MVKRNVYTHLHPTVNNPYLYIIFFYYVEKNMQSMYNNTVGIGGEVLEVWLSE